MGNWKISYSGIHTASTYLRESRVIARVPGKIILSGEHAVVYGKQALATAVNKFVETSIFKCSEHSNNKIYFEFINNNSGSALASVLTLQDLIILRADVDKRYQDFINNKCSIKNVIRSPLELVQYEFIYLAQNLCAIIKNDIKIQIKLAMPAGCGMGASAAVILSLMHALVNYFSCSITTDKYLYFGREIENLQHGKSSGLDLFLSLNGGCYFFADGSMARRNMPNIPLVLVNTGKPQTSTGECVAAVAKYFQDNNIADDFSCVTVEMDKALQQNNLQAIQQCIHENHKLLNYIGVVPNKVAEFITAISKLCSAAKISGAGAVSGSNAGIVLVVGETPITEIAKEYGYEILAVQEESHGLQII